MSKVAIMLALMALPACGPSTPYWAIERAGVVCADRGGVTSIRYFLAFDVVCRDGSTHDLVPAK